MSELEKRSTRFDEASERETEREGKRRERGKEEREGRRDSQTEGRAAEAEFVCARNFFFLFLRFLNLLLVS